MYDKITEYKLNLGLEKNYLEYKRKTGKDTQARSSSHKLALSFLVATSKRAVEAVLTVHKDKDTRLSRTTLPCHVTPDKWFNFYLDSVSLSTKTDEKLMNLCDFFFSD